MIEISHISKIYKTKGGAITRALDDVSIKIEKKGLVFLLGKSGSGKSTLLNVIGGLDKPDSGEVIIKGKSSKNFSTSDFDNYRNTFIGFVFQEYNILNEFNVEQNIALALQLQGKKADEKTVNKILETVDLSGLNKRKPNTLSGGQKQRIAIARALIKNLDIILADEPTGALDSNTGKQVFDTLKSLSKDKLIIVVSHDRDFAEEYGDRIIELKDGKIISDVSKEFVPPVKVSENLKIVNKNVIDISKGSALSNEDAKSILSYLKACNSEIIITTTKHDVESTKKAIKMSETGHGEVFNETKQVNVEDYDGSKTTFIKSKMPFSRSWKMGVSGLKNKPVRLLLTIILSAVSFGMFGLVSTMSLYNESYTVQEAEAKADYTGEIITKDYRFDSQYVEINKAGEVNAKSEQKNLYNEASFGIQELKDISTNDLDFAGIFNIGNVATYEGMSIPTSMSKYLYGEFCSIQGFSDCGSAYANKNFKLLAGSYPTNKNEIAISEYHFEYIKNQTGSTINNYADAIGKEVDIYTNKSNGETLRIHATIKGVYDVGSIPSKYDELKKSSSTKTEEEIVSLAKNFNNFLRSSFESIVMVDTGFYTEYGSNAINKVENPDRFYAYGVEIQTDQISREVSTNTQTDCLLDESVNANRSAYKIYDLDNNLIEGNLSMKEDDIYVSKYYYENVIQNENINCILKSANYVTDHAFYDPTADVEVGSSSSFYEAVERFKSNRHSSSYPAGYDKASDLLTITTGTNKWYSTLYRDHQIYSWTVELVSNYKTDSKYLAIPAEERDNLETLKNKIDTSSFSSISENERTKAETTLVNYANNIMSNNKLCDYALELYDCCSYLCEYKDFNEFYEYVNSLGGSEVYRTKFYAGLATEKEINQARAIVDKYYTRLSSSPAKYIFDKDYSLKMPNHALYFKNYQGNSGKLTIKGYYATPSYYSYSYNFILNKNFYNKYAYLDNPISRYITTTDYVSPNDAKYVKAFSKSTFTSKQIDVFIKDSGSYRYRMTDSIYTSISSFTSMITSMKNIFIITGAILGVFAALLLVNFITLSINLKKKEIGILRAVGARGSDVFKIFFAESFVMSIISFIIAAVGAGVGCYFINQTMVKQLNMAVLNYGFINIILILAITLFITVIATFIPTKIASRKPPVEAIRSL